MSQITKKGLSADAVDGSKIKLANDEALKARNAADNADIEIVKVDAADKVNLGIYAFPSTDGTSGQVLSTDGAGELSWITSSASPAGSSGQVQFNNSGSFGASSNFVWDNTNARIGIRNGTPSASIDISPGSAEPSLIMRAVDGYGAAYRQDATSQTGGRAYEMMSSTDANGDIGGGKWVIRDTAVSGAAGYRMVIDSNGNTQLGADTPGFYWDNANKRLGLSTGSPGSALDVKGTIRLSGSTSGYVGLVSPASPTSVTYTLPNADGTSGQVLSTDGAGALSWASAGGGGANQSLSNLTSPTAINQDLIFDIGANAVIRTKDDSGPTYNLEIRTGNSSGDVPGNLTIEAGSGGTNSNTGSVSIGAQDATGTGNGGGVSLYTAGSAGGNAGDLEFYAAEGSVNGKFLFYGSNTMELQPYGTDALPLHFYDANGANYVGFVAPNSVTTSVEYTLPEDGTSGQVLSTNGSGVLSWTNAGGGATWDKVVVTLSAGDITNQYYDLSQIALTDSIQAFVKGQGMGIEQTGEDYSVSYTGGAGGNTRINFQTNWATGGGSELVAGDKLVIQYQY